MVWEEPGVQVVSNINKQVVELTIRTPIFIPEEVTKIRTGLLLDQLG